MRVNIYAEEMTEQVELISKEIDGHSFTGLRLYLYLPVTVGGGSYRTPRGSHRSVKGSEEVFPPICGKAAQVSGPFMHRPGDDDSSAVTFWGKKDLRPVLRKMLNMLDDHYADALPDALPTYRCPECGPGSTSDADGCCYACGASLFTDDDGNPAHNDTDNPEGSVPAGFRHEVSKLCDRAGWCLASRHAGDIQADLDSLEEQLAVVQRLTNSPTGSGGDVKIEWESDPVSDPQGSEPREAPPDTAGAVRNIKAAMAAMDLGAPPKASEREDWFGTALAELEGALGMLDRKAPSQ